MKAIVATFVFLIAAGWAADVFAADAADAPAPGLKLTLESGGVTDVRPARLIALRVAHETPPSPFLAPGAFKATWEGALALRIKDDYVFSAAGRGTFKLTINDQVVLDVSGDDLSTTKSLPIRLKKGANIVRAEYASPAAGDGGDAWVRLYWANSGFIAETIPPMQFTHDGADAALVGQNNLREARGLVANLRCLKCHSGGGAMQELSADTPSLTDVGQRLTQSWLAHWIDNPHAIRADTEMPRVFAGAEGAVDQRARDIAAYLVASSAKAQATAHSDADSAELVSRGTRLYTSLGCVACHLLPDQKASDDFPGRVSLAFVKAKFQPGALKEFLLKPEAHYQWIRMPNFRLSDDEAAALAAFLRSRAAGELKGETDGDAGRGEKLFQSSGCISCHGSKLTNELKAASLAEVSKSDFTRGCMAKAADLRGKAPEYLLTDEQRAAIATLGKTQFASLARDSGAEFASRQIAQLNCAACHPRDKVDDTLSQLGPEIEALVSKLPAEQNAAEVSGDQARPPLTWVGEKLRPAWAAKFIAGEVSYKPRPWLVARMPGFPARAKALALGLTQEHGCSTADAVAIAPDAQMADAGRKLVGKNGGFSCVQCHSVGEMRALAPFEAPAINFAYVTDRLTKEFYDRWVYNPQRVVPGTRMPQFAGSDGKTALKDSFDGDARKQFDAIWNYLLAGEKITPPPTQ